MCIFRNAYAHTYMYKYILYTSQKNCGKVAQPRNSRLRHFLLGHHCPFAVVAKLAGLCSPNICKYIYIYVYIYILIFTYVYPLKKVVAKWLNREILS